MQNSPSIIDLSAFVPAKPAKRTANAKRSAAIAKASKPASKPAKQAGSEQPAADNAKRAARRAMLLTARKLAAIYYDGASLAAHRTVPPTLADCIERVREPVQRAKSVSERDESGLALALKHTDANKATFDPVACGFDLGILSRLASLKHVMHNAAGFSLTATGLSLARGVVSRKR